MSCISSSVEPLSKRERLQDRDGLMLAEDESARALYLADYEHHFRLRHRDDIVRKDLNVLFGILGLHDLLQINLGTTESAPGIQRRSGAFASAPAHFPMDAGVS